MTYIVSSGALNSTHSLTRRRRCSEGSHWQATTSAQYCRARHQRHRQVWSWTDAAAPWEAPLVWCQRSCDVKSGGHGPSMPAWTVGHRSTSVFTES